MQRIAYERIVIDDEQAGADVSSQWSGMRWLGNARRIASNRAELKPTLRQACRTVEHGESEQARW
jgi:hypothetical protein